MKFVPVIFALMACIGVMSAEAREGFSCSAKCEYFHEQSYNLHESRSCSFRDGVYGDPIVNVVAPHEFMMSTGSTLEEAFNALSDRCERAGGFLYNEMYSYQATGRKGSDLYCSRMVLTSPLDVCK